MLSGSPPIPAITRSQAGEGNIFRRPRESGDPEPAPGLNRGQPLLYELVIQVPPLRILALDHFEFPGTMPLLDALFTKDRIHHGLVKLHKD